MAETQFEFHVAGYNVVHDNGVNIDRPDGSGDYLFLYLKSNVTILTAEGEVSTQEPSFLLYEKGFPQKYYDETGPFVNDWMHFQGNGVKEFFTRLDIPVNQIMVLQDATQISFMLQDICTESRQQGKFHKEILDYKMKVMFYKFSDLYHEEIKFSDKLNRYRRAFHEVRNRIYSYAPGGNATKVSDIAESLNLSTSYFQHIYKKLFGVSVMNDIIKSRIEYACYLLASNSDSISEIAFQCGYENKEHFTRQFKDITGYTPRQYRENC
jgi:AraC family transcriptional regulator of arabinose operon